MIGSREALGYAKGIRNAGENLIVASVAYILLLYHLQPTRLSDLPAPTSEVR